jgi:GntR family transcriptional regulator
MSKHSSSALILEYLKATSLAPGDKLPAEIDMARTLGLSRNSIREAYAELAAQGLLDRRHGIGTFLSAPPIVNDFGNTRAFWGMIEAAGARPSLREIAAGTELAVDGLARQMRLEPGTPVRRLRWLFCANDRPMTLIDHFLAPRLRIDGIDWQDKRNVLAALADQLQIDGAELETQHTAVAAGPVEAGLLALPVGTAILYGQAIVHDGDGSMPIVSRHWSNPRLFGVAQRMPIRPKLI